MRLDDTIVAISSPPGRAPRGLVRLTGDEAERILHDLTGLRTATSHALHRARIDGRIACLVGVFRGPRSYTGQDSVELQTVGHPTLLDRIVNRCVEAGARRAGPGEFTARAHFNGRLSLVEAEGVAATIAAESDAQLRAAHMLTKGRIGRLAHAYADRLAQGLALLEAEIDFVEEEDVVAIEPVRLYNLVKELHLEVHETLERSTGAAALSATPCVVLAGPPNAGKSTLFNALLGRHRAVVRAVSGTTRDVLVEPVHLDPADPYSPEVMLVDLAGLEPGQAGLTRSMQEAAHDAMARADLLLWLVPSDESKPIVDPPAALASIPCVHVHTKADLLRGEHSEDGLIQISAQTGAGIEMLRARIGAELAGATRSISADALTLLPRHEAALERTRNELQAALTMLHGMRALPAIRDPELIAASLRGALDALAELAGDITPDDVLGRIFAGFCIGK